MSIIIFHLRKVFLLTTYFFIWHVVGMELKKHIKQKNLKQRQVAKEMGITEGYLSKLISGDQIPSAILALKFDKWSKGAVKLKDFFSV